VEGHRRAILTRQQRSAYTCARLRAFVRALIPVVVAGGDRAALPFLVLSGGSDQRRVFKLLYGRFAAFAEVGAVCVWKVGRAWYFCPRVVASSRKVCNRISVLVRLFVCMYSCMLVRV
jgi:hypothetical protein